MPTSTFLYIFSQKNKSRPILTIFSFGHQMGSCAKNYKNLPSSLFLGINGLISILSNQGRPVIYEMYMAIYQNLDRIRQSIYM